MTISLDSQVVLCSLETCPLLRMQDLLKIRQNGLEMSITSYVPNLQIMIRAFFSKYKEISVNVFHDCDGDHKHSVRRVLVTMATALALEE